MKKQSMLLVLFTVMGFSLFAVENRGFSKSRGNNRDGNRTERQEEREKNLEEYLETAEKVSKSGVLVLENGEMPKVEVDGVIYTICAPFNELRDLGLKDGITIKFEGYIMPNPPLIWETKEVSVMLTTITVNRVETEIENPGMRGGRGRGSRNENRGNNLNRKGR